MPYMQYNESLNWPGNLPDNLSKSIKRLELYRKREKLAIFYELEVEKVEARAKMAESIGRISERDLIIILKKMGVYED